AWYNATSQDRARPCGSLLPNDLGLFDMLGNAYEWAQDVPETYRPDRNNKVFDDISNYLIEDIKNYIIVDNTNHRLLRGGTFDFRPAFVRSAYRGSDPPSHHFASSGFRPARTCP